MKDYKKIPAMAALLGAVTLGSSVAITPAEASRVKCYGIAKAGQNDCGNASGTHGCAGHSTIDYDGGEWKLAKNPEDCAEKGGKLKPFEGKGGNA